MKPKGLAGKGIADRDDVFGRQKGKTSERAMPPKRSQGRFPWGDPPRLLSTKMVKKDWRGTN